MPPTFDMPSDDIVVVFGTIGAFICGLVAYELLSWICNRIWK